MRALCDPNVVISSLLTTTRPNSTIGLIMSAAVRGTFVLVWTPEVATEILESIRDNPYLAARISLDRANGFVNQLQRVADVLPPLLAPASTVARDPDDDYLLSQAEAGQADFLVTGDKDLLSLRDRQFSFTIVSPAEFLAILREEGLA